MKNNPMHPQRDGDRLFTGTDLVQGHWPEIELAVRASLLRRGVSREDAADILQETALRAVSRGLQFDSVEGFRRWAFVVARHLVVAQARGRRATAVAAVPDAPAAGADVAATVEGRMAAAAVVSALGQMSASDRHAIRGAIDAPAAPAPSISRREYVKVAVRRHRARQRLMALCEGLLAALTFAWRRIVQPAAQLAAAAVPVWLGIMLWSGGLTGEPARPIPDAGAVAMPAGVLPTVMSPAVAGPTGPTTAVPADDGSQERSGLGSARPPATPAPVAVIRVPAANNAGVRTRPRGHDDHELCADTLVAGNRCVDSPALPPPIGP